VLPASTTCAGDTPYRALFVGFTDKRVLASSEQNDILLRRVYAPIVLAVMNRVTSAPLQRRSVVGSLKTNGWHAPYAVLYRQSEH
jgi:hypothetical protein